MDTNDSVPTASDDDGSDEAPRPSITWPKALVLALACAFAAAAGMNAWNHRAGPKPSTADVEFFDDMSTHHVQAIALARIYNRRGEDRLLLHIADEIRFDQAGDIRVMVGHIADWGAEPDTKTAMAWMAMAVPQDAQPGMATPAEIDALSNLSGAALDEEFTRLMINHHAGGIEMSDGVIELASTKTVRTIASGMGAVQRREIGEMNFWRKKQGLAPMREDLVR